MAANTKKTQPKQPEQERRFEIRNGLRREIISWEDRVKRSHEEARRQRDEYMNGSKEMYI